MQEPLALKGISCYSSRESSTRNESFSCCDPYNCEVKCNLDIGNYGYLQSGKSDAVQVTPFCEVSISSHNGGLSEDRSMCQASIKGHWKQSHFRESINDCLFSSVHLDVTLESWLIGSRVEGGSSDVEAGDLFFLLFYSFSSTSLVSLGNNDEGVETLFGINGKRKEAYSWKICHKYI